MENSTALYLCRCLVIEISEAGPEGGGKGRFVCEWGRGPLHTHLHRCELGKVGSGPGAGISIEQAESDLHLKLDGGQQCVDQPGTTLSALGGTEDAAGAEAAVVALHWSDYEGSEYTSGLTAVTAVKALEEARRRGHAQALAQGLEEDLLVLDLDWRQFEKGGSWGRQGENAARRIKTRGCCGDQGGVEPV
ncbi:predicted protein [Postia placenta Mad-698-R]|nr:predicted protein [Postia placenta Mad-698-R]